LTKRDGAASSPAWSISLTPRSSPAEVVFIASRRSWEARLQTNSPVSSMKVRASFRPAEEKATMGGLSETWLKNE
jgi:hypothetical protein